MGAEHRRAIADLQVSKREAVAECERVLTEVQQALLARDRSLEIERRLIDGIDEGARKKADGERLAALQGGLTLAFSKIQAVLKDGEGLNKPVEAEHNELERPTIETIDKPVVEAADNGRLGDEQVAGTQTVADPLSELFDDADDAFVRHLLEESREPPLPGSHTDPTVGSAQPVSDMQTVTADDQPEHDVFDPQDDAFVVRLMNGTAGPTPESGDQTDTQPLRELPEIPPSPPEDS